MNTSNYSTIGLIDLITNFVSKDELNHNEYVELMVALSEHGYSLTVVTPFISEVTVELEDHDHFGCLHACHTTIEVEAYFHEEDPYWVVSEKVAQHLS